MRSDMWAGPACEQPYECVEGITSPLFAPENVQPESNKANVKHRIYYRQLIRTLQKLQHHPKKYDYSRMFKGETEVIQ